MSEPENNGSGCGCKGSCCGAFCKCSGSCAAPSENTPASEAGGCAGGTCPATKPENDGPKPGCGCG